MRTTRRGYLAAAAGTAAGLAGCIGGAAGPSGGGNCPAAKSGKVKTLAAPVIGDPEADVTVAAFEDFACPHCKHYSLETFPPIRKQFVDTKKVRYEQHDFPIPVNKKWSWAAGNAARSVQEQTDDATYFEYAHSLFENQTDYSMSLLGDLADRVGATPCAVRAAARDDTYKPVLESDRQDGIKKGVRGTPTVFVNGKPVRATVSDIRAAIKSKL
ncbi:MAG: DsbA family protein [Salinigranum sp.]